MGASYSCNDKWYTLRQKLQNSAERRKQMRRGCSCARRRPKFLRLRRKVRKRVCKCAENTENLFELNTLKCPKAVYFKDMHICSNNAGYRCQGTNTCFLESQDEEIQGAHAHSKNVCRFTVDAYFT